MRDVPRDPLECDVVHVATRAAMNARGLVCATAFLVETYTRNGECTPIYFPSIGAVVDYLRVMNPARTVYHLAKHEDVAALEAEVRAAAAIPVARAVH